MQSQKAVSAYLKSKQISHFDFARQYKYRWLQQTLHHRLRRWPNIKSTLIQGFVFSGMRAKERHPIASRYDFDPTSKTATWPSQNQTKRMWALSDYAAVCWCVSRSRISRWFSLAHFTPPPFQRLQILYGNCIFKCRFFTLVRLKIDFHDKFKQIYNVSILKSPTNYQVLNVKNIY